MTPPAPPLLSTTTATPSACDSGWAIRRAIWSVAPPGAQGTRMRMVCSGQAAKELDAPSASSEATKARRAMLGAGIFMGKNLFVVHEVAQSQRQLRHVRDHEQAGEHDEHERDQPRDDAIQGDFRHRA